MTAAAQPDPVPPGAVPPDPAPPGAERSDVERSAAEAPALAVQLRVRGSACLVVGGGRVATRRVATLRTAGARVVVVAPAASSELVELAAAGAVELRLRPFVEGDVTAAGPDRPLLVVAATDDPAVNDRVGEVADAAGVLVNRADDAGQGHVAFPVTATRGPLTVAVSSRPAAPAVSRWAAGRIEDALDEVLGLDGDGLAALVGVVAEVRRELRTSGSSDATGERGVTAGAVDWRSTLDGSILELIHQGRTAEAKERLLACLSS